MHRTKKLPSLQKGVTLYFARCQIRIGYNALDEAAVSWPLSPNDGRELARPAGDAAETKARLSSRRGRRDKAFDSTAARVVQMRKQGSTRVSLSERRLSGSHWEDAQLTRVPIAQ